MIGAYGEDIAYAMCGGCPVPLAARNAFCNMVKGMAAFEHGNLCLLREIERRQNGILKLTPFRPYNNDEVAQAALERRRQMLRDAEINGDGILHLEASPDLWTK